MKASAFCGLALFAPFAWSMPAPPMASDLPRNDMTSSPEIFNATSLGLPPGWPFDLDNWWPIPGLGHPYRRAQTSADAIDHGNRTKHNNNCHSPFFPPFKWGECSVLVEWKPHYDCFVCNTCERFKKTALLGPFCHRFTGQYSSCRDFVFTSSSTS